MMGMDNTTCPSEGPVAGWAVGITASAGRRGLGPQLAAAVRGCGLGPRPLGWLANAIGTTECESSTARGNAVCGRTACTVWEEAGGNAPMMPSPLWLAGWNIGGAPLAYLIGHSCIPTGQHPPTRRWIRAKTMRRFSETLLSLHTQLLEVFVLLGDQPCGRVVLRLGLLGGERLGGRGAERARGAFRDVDPVRFATVGFPLARPLGEVEAGRHSRSRENDVAPFL